MNALDYCSACLAVTDFHTKAYFFASYQEGWGGQSVDRRRSFREWRNTSSGLGRRSYCGSILVHVSALWQTSV